MQSHVRHLYGLLTAVWYHGGHFIWLGVYRRLPFLYKVVCVMEYNALILIS